MRRRNIPPALYNERRLREGQKRNIVRPQNSTRNDQCVAMTESQIGPQNATPANTTQLHPVATTRQSTSAVNSDSRSLERNNSSQSKLFNS